MKKIVLLVSMMAMPFLMFSQELKFGYVNAAQILETMPEISDVEKQMADYNAQNTKYLQDMETEIQSEQKKYEQMGETVSDIVRGDQEEKVRSLYQRYQNTLRTIQATSQDKQAALLKPIQEKLLKAIETVSKKNNFFMVFNMDDGNILYKSDKAIDLTALVKKELGI
ncbi:MAG: OmpH family outer membrane protein [Prevotellaceae bacterium]|jgi:outer membrane protein|nr:OmpH family outer membrane protein [Prevotellaceae bacterium]